ncbi:MFS transporter [Saccharothrix sp. BKS2]|uniref:MFS transporter n=1 Tax=Saccharothrix sp. BKS2 TaxID=3064400 RepID=UPI0039EA87BD
MLFRNRDFGLLWSGETVSLLGSEVSVIALPSLAVLAFGQGAVGVGLLVALQWLPFVLLAPILGVLTDRLRRLPLMQIANVARFVILGSLPLAWALGGLTIAHLYVAALLKGVFDVVFQLAYQAYLTQLLPREDFLDGNAKTQLSRSLSIVFGRSIGGALVGLLGAARAITVDAVSYLVSFVALSRIRAKEPEVAPSGGRGLAATMADLRSGLSITFGNRLLRYLTLMAMFGNLAVSMVLAMIIVFAYRDLGFTPAELGLALGVGGAPVLLGALLSRRVNEGLGIGRTLILTHVLLGVAFLIFPLADTGSKATALVVVMVAEGIATFTSPIANVGIMSLIQRATPPEAMGRMGGVALPLVWGANAAGPLIGAAVAALFASNVIPFLVASLLAFLAVVWVVAGGVHRLKDEVPEDMRVVL